LNDALQEAVDDTLTEQHPTRPDAFARLLRFQEQPLETSEDLMNWRTLGQKHAAQSLGKPGWTVWLTGNHLGVLPIYEQLQTTDLVIQFDAHLDCYQLHDTTPTLGHGNFLCHARTLPRIINLGHRDLFLTPADTARYFEAIYSAEQIELDREAVLTAIRSAVATAPRIWIDLDVDVFDPADCPAVAGPVPFGPRTTTILALLQAAWSPQLAGISISEFVPARDRDDRSLQLLGWLQEWLLLKWHEGYGATPATQATTPKRGRKKPQR
jgi:arginase family enzyme